MFEYKKAYLLMYKHSLIFAFSLLIFKRCHRINTDQIIALQKMFKITFAFIWHLVRWTLL